MSATATLAPPAPRIVAWSRMGDESLAARAAGGDTGAFAALYERYHGPLLGYTRSILRDAEDARDATQNALENALRALPSRDTSRPLRPWLYKIAHNEAISIMRRRRPQTELSPLHEPIVPGPEVDAEQRGRLEQLVDDLQTLPERQRGALVMRELNGLSYDEIGAALGLTNQAARRAVFDARSALHDAVDGRATECTSVRHSISDGDRRSLRARSIRAHLRSCDDCASFQRSIGTRRADLHALAPWMSGAAVAGVLGLGGGVGGGGALIASGAGVSAGGAGWAGLPMAVKGLAVAAAVATTGTAAVEIKHAAEPSRSAPQSQTAQARPSQAGAAALREAARAAAAARRSATPAVPRRADRVRPATGTATSSATVLPVARPDRDTPALAPPAPQAQRKPSPAATAPATPAPAKQSAPAKAPVTAISQLDALRKQVEQAFADAQAIAADGTRDSLALATSMLDRTLGPLRTAIDAVLATLGMSLPAAQPAPAPATQPTTTNVLQPVEQVLSGMQQLLQQLLGGS